MTKAQIIALAALRRSRRAVSRANAAKPGPVGETGKPGLQGPAGPPGALVVMPPPVSPQTTQPVGILDVEIEQEDLDVFFVITFTDGTSVRRKAKLPEGKPGEKGRDGSFWVRGGIANVLPEGAGTQQVYVIGLLDPAPTYAGVPLVVFRETGAPDTYTMEIITS